MDLQLIYDTFISDDSILTLTQLAKKFNFGSKRCGKMRLGLYELYGKDHILKISRSRLGKHSSKKQWETRSRTMSEEVKLKIAESNKLTWQLDDGSRKEICRKTMVKNASSVDRKEVTKKAIITRKKRDKWAEYSVEGHASLIEHLSNRKISDTTRKKQSESAKKRGYNRSIDWKPSEETKEKCRIATKKRWETGLHKTVFRSKSCQSLVIELKALGYDVTEEFFISGRPFDIKIGNCIIEFNGTYWHLDPRKYDDTFYDKYRKCYATEIWERDKNKQLLAESSGFRFMTVWQYDWENNKQGVLDGIRQFVGNFSEYEFTT